jgi:hypothetical protein
MPLSVKEYLQQRQEKVSTPSPGVAPEKISDTEMQKLSSQEVKSGPALDSPFAMNQMVNHAEERVKKPSFWDKLNSASKYVTSAVTGGAVGVGQEYMRQNPKETVEAGAGFVKSAAQAPIQMTRVLGAEYAGLQGDEATRNELMKPMNVPILGEVKTPSADPRDITELGAQSSGESALQALDLYGMAGAPGAEKAISKVGAGFGKVAESVAPKLSKAASSNLQNTYKRVLNMTGKATASEAEWGKNTPKILERENVPINLDETGRLDLGEGIDALRAKYAERAPKVRELVSDTGQYHSLDQVRDAAKAEIRKELANKGADMQKALDQVDKEFAAYKSTYNKPGIGIAQGEDVLVPSHVLDDIKSGQWDKAFSTKIPNKEEIISNDVNYKIGHAAKNMIESSVADANLASMNSELGDLQQAIKTLQSRNGQLPRGGGVLTKALSSMTGAALGASIGGVPGFVAGGLAGDRMAGLVASRKVPLRAWAALRDALAVTDEGSALVKNVDAVLGERSAARASRKLLPAPSQIQVGPIGSSSASPSKIYSQDEANKILEELGAFENRMIDSQKIKDAKARAESLRKTEESLKKWMENFDSNPPKY